MADIQWWCSARGTAWSWTWRGFPGVWAFVLLSAAVLRPIQIRRRGGPEAWRRWCGVLGVILLWGTLDWPVGLLGVGYLAAVHALQFVSLAMVAPPLLLLSVDRKRVAAWLARHAGARRTIRLATTPLPTMVWFSLVVVVTHVPLVVDTLMRSQPGACGLDFLWFTSGAVFWWPVVVGAPERPTFSPPLRLLYLFFRTQVHVLIGMWLMLARFPVYATYELAPRVLPLSALSDQQVAAGIMIVLPEAFMLAVISVIFFRWFASEADHHPRGRSASSDPRSGFMRPGGASE